MRHLVLALMIALLPIRGWVGDVMATEMASSKATLLQDATEMVAAHADGAGAEALFGHASMDLPAAQPAPDCHSHGESTSHPTADTHGESCTACQACHSVALSPWTSSMPAAMALPTLPRSVAARFASAVAAPGHKPPIA